MRGTPGFFWRVCARVTVAIRAIYEGGKLRLLELLDLAENPLVQISLETGQDDAERREWLEL